MREWTTVDTGTDRASIPDMRDEGVVLGDGGMIIEARRRGCDQVWERRQTGADA